jgi:hypothetical protein
LLIVWIARPATVDAAFSTWLWPLLGIIFLPFATLIYVLLYTPGRGLSGWDWFWVVLAALLDIGHWAAGPASGTRSRAGAPPKHRVPAGRLRRESSDRGDGDAGWRARVTHHERALRPDRFAGPLASGSQSFVRRQACLAAASPVWGDATVGARRRPSGWTARLTTMEYVDA